MSENLLSTTTNCFKKIEEKIFLQTGVSYEAVIIGEILYISSAGTHSNVFLQNGQILEVNGYLTFYKTLFRDKGFYSPNRTCLINIYHIDSIFRNQTLIMSNGVKQHVSIRNRKEFSSLLRILKGEYLAIP